LLSPQECGLTTVRNMSEDLKKLKCADKVLKDLYKMADQSQPWLKEWIDRRFAEYMEQEEE